MTPQTEAAARSGDALRDHPMMLACRREPAPYTPIWLMRQAGRYMPEYRRVRAQHDFLEMCQRPEVAAEVTVTAVERLGVDAAIIFADILLPLIPMEVGLHYEKEDGPIIERPVRSAVDLERIPESTPRERSVSSVTRSGWRAVRLASHSADRICRRAVHARLLSDRGRRLAPVPGDQNHDVHRARRRGIA